MTKKQITKQFLDFLSSSPTVFHTVDSAKKILVDAGFTELKEKDPWKLKKNSAYFITRGGTSLIAFKTGKYKPSNGGAHIIGTHTDSPGLKIKVHPEKKFKGYLSLMVEVYGGAIIDTWFDRELSIAGSVSYLTKKKKLVSTLIDFKRPVGIIPNLAIHLQPKNNNKSPVNKQTEILPLVLQAANNKETDVQDFKQLIAEQLIKKESKTNVDEILDYDLWFYNPQKPCTIGFNEEFIVGGRLDNLLSCFVGLRALVESDADTVSILVCNDHEEVGSSSYTGAAGPFLKTVLERICLDKEEFLRTVSQSLLISVDNAHGVHPNYQARHDENHGPILNKGPVIKLNANQRYATTSETSAFFRHICRQANIPVQSFISRSDLPCGTTIGPITATTLGINTLDIGAPTFAMHSIRETCGTDDIWHIYKALKKTYNG